ncbi:glutathione S-transferase [Falsirhodobacter sp. alg1]|uniref:glutathione S-transferase n=1 Tax=Falsirhodobacter sp. alg1 TaxID=1472418 RepID=UPI0005EDBC0D|nr:glutathione S-transferase [Falsirhodobacter sp. alg1]
MAPYTLAIGDKSFSSWSLRAWLAFDKAGIPVSTLQAPLYQDAFAEVLKAFAPARTVPALRLPDGTVIWDSIAIAEELHSRHPEAGLWPTDAALRATGRALVAEMHSGFAALRSHCPMNLRIAYRDVPVPDAAAQDLARVERLWSHALDISGGPWLLGEWSLADAAYAPLAMRVAGYDLPVGKVAHAYVAQHLADNSIRRWRAMGLVRDSDLVQYHKDWPRRTWPFPTPLAARAVDGTEAENDTCPYSGDPVTHVLEMDGRRWGFCNPTCRDKTVADPAAWPAFMAMIGR